MGRQQASKIYKTKRKSRDLDEILHEDLKSQASIQALENQKFDEYLPGLGQHYCVPCAKHFESDVALKSHVRQKVHKRRLRELKFGPYTPEEANAGAGRDVEKFLAKRREQDLIQGQLATSAQLNPARKEKHRKSSRRRAETDAMEAEPIETEAAETAEAEEADAISV